MAPRYRNCSATGTRSALSEPKLKTFRAHKRLRRNFKLALFTKEVLLAVQSSYKRYTSKGKCLLPRLLEPRSFTVCRL